MDIKPYKNKFDYEIVDCPFCSYFAYLREATKISPDPLRDLKRHITHSAKNEALDYFLDNKVAIPHLAYFVEHTKEKVFMPRKAKRQYDEDLIIKT